MFAADTDSLPMPALIYRDALPSVSIWRLRQILISAGIL
jgi:hypothetical protein